MILKKTKTQFWYIIIVLKKKKKKKNSNQILVKKYTFPIFIFKTNLQTNKNLPKEIIGSKFYNIYKNNVVSK
jgi:hypothetical protein